MRISMGLCRHVFRIVCECHGKSNEEVNVPHIGKEKLLGINMLAVPPRH